MSSVRLKADYLTKGMKTEAQDQNDEQTDG